MRNGPLFVYGSLKRDGRHHAELRGARFLGEACTAAGYALVPVGDYWALVRQPGSSSVTGELFQVDEALLTVLDEFEGEDYRRELIHVHAANAGPFGFEPSPAPAPGGGGRARAGPDPARAAEFLENFLALAYLSRTR